MNAVPNTKTLTRFQQKGLVVDLQVRWLDPDGLRTGNYFIESIEGPIAVGTRVNLASEMSTTATAFVEDLYPARDIEEVADEDDEGLSDFQRTLDVGQEVFWSDPDGDSLSGIYKVLNIELFEGLARHGETGLLLSAETGTETEAYLHEVREVTEDDRKVTAIRVTINLEYPANGASAADIIAQLQRAIDRCIQRENLLGEPTGYSVEIDELHEVQDAAELLVPTPPAPIAFGPDAIPLLVKAERFISGFEDDAEQEGVKELLAGLRGQLAKLPPAIVLTTIRDGIDAARNVVNEWEGRNLAGAVNCLEGWTTAVSDISVTDEHPLAYTLAAGFQAAGEVLANWERGDLAAAVRNLDDWIDGAVSELGQMGLLSPISVVWMSGGVIQDVTTLGDARVVVVDVDEGEVDGMPDVPTSPEFDDSSEAKVSVYDGGNESSRVWAEHVASLEQISDRASDAYWDKTSKRPDRDCDPDCARRQVPAAECTCSRSQ